jgi:ankyrin repeat protein
MQKAPQITKENVNSRDEVGSTKLMYAALNGNLTEVERLISLGADASLTNELGENALYYLVREGVIQPLANQIAQILIDNGAEVNILTALNRIAQRGDTPLYMAVHNSDIEMVKLLIDNKADISVVCRGNDTALRRAERYQLKDILYTLSNETLSRSSTYSSEMKIDCFLIAAKYGFIDLIRYTLDNYKLANGLLQDGIDKAIFSNHKEIIEEITNHFPFASRNSFLRDNDDYLFKKLTKNINEFTYMLGHLSNAEERQKVIGNVFGDHQIEKFELPSLKQLKSIR